MFSLQDVVPVNQLEIHINHQTCHSQGVLFDINPSSSTYKASLTNTPVNMARLYRFAVSSAIFWQSLASASPEPCLNGLCQFTRNKLASRTVASELGPQLSANCNVYGPDDTEFGSCTARYDPFFTPKIQMVVQPATEEDVPKIV